MPRAKVRIATTAKPGLLRIIRRPKTRFERSSSISSPLYDQNCEKFREGELSLGLLLRRASAARLPCETSLRHMLPGTFFCDIICTVGERLMSEQQNVSLIQKMFEAFGRGDIRTILDSCAADCEFYYPGPAIIPKACRLMDQMPLYSALQREIRRTGRRARRLSSSNIVVR
jgi:hypothetical protein